MTKQGFLILLAILVIIAGLAMVVYGNFAKPTSVLPNPQNAQNTPPTSNLLIVSDQKASAMVTISQADLTQPGFVVVKDANGRTLGESVLLSASKNTLVYVPAQTQTGKTYSAYIYFDNGNGKFDSGDQALIDTSGKVFSVSFKSL